MPPTAEESRTSLNNAEDLEGEESDEYDVEDDEGDEEYDDEGDESEQNGKRSNLTALLLGEEEEEDDEEYSDAEAGPGSVPTGSTKRTRDRDEGGNKDGDDEQGPKKLKV
jgi:hypothetical protein